MTVPVPVGHHPVSAIVTSPGKAIIAAQVSLASGRANMNNVTGTLPVANGGTGATKLGSGLSVDGDALNLGPLTDSGSGASVQTDGSGIFGVTGEGWSEQDTTTGKNLYHETNYPIGHNRTTVGINVTKIGNTEYMCSGTATANAWLYAGGETVTDSFFTTLPAGTYTASVTGAPRVVVRKRVDGSQSAVGQSDEGVYTFTLNESTDILVVPVIPKDVTVSNLYVTVQLEAGSTATEYEPYTGGAPSPSPDYPQEIKVCKGRNLLDCSGTPPSSNRCKVSYNNGTISLTCTESGFVYARFDATTTIGETYTLSCELNSGSVSLRDENDSGNVFVLTGSSSRTFVATQSVSKIRLFKDNCSVGDVLTFRPQLELGSTPTPYVPYGHVGLELQGRNLLPQDSESAYSAAGWTIGGSSTGVYGDFESGQYAISAECVTAASGKKLEFGFFDASGTNVGGTTVSMSEVGRHYATVTLTGDAVRVRAYLDGGACKNIQIEAGTTATEYEPYHHETRAIPLPLKSDGERWAGGLPDGTADALAIDSAGRWEWVNNANEVVFDGSSDEEWGIVSGYESLFKIDNVIPDATKAKPNSLSSHFARTISAAASMTSGQYKADISGTNQRLLYKYTDVSTVADWTTWLASNNVTLLYPLATSTTEHGYIDLPELPNGATVSIPELEAIGVEWWVNGAEAIAEHGRDVSKANREQENRIAELEAAVANMG